MRLKRILICLLLLAWCSTSFWLDLKPNVQDIDAISAAPSFTNGHLLGTDDLGRDLLRNLLASSRTDLIIAFLAIGIAGVLGVVVGGLSGYIGNKSIRIEIVPLMLTSLLLLPIWFYIFYLHQYTSIGLFENHFVFGISFFFLQLMISILLLFISYRCWQKVFQRLHIRRTILFPLDAWINRFFEIYMSIPTLFFMLMAIALVSKPSMAFTVLIIAAVKWIQIARLMRAEVISIKATDFITAANSLGFSSPRILFVHMLRNTTGPISVAMAFGAAQSILLTSLLSFLGIGLSDVDVSLGSLLYLGYESPKSWWLSIFPGLIMLGYILTFCYLGQNDRKINQNLTLGN